MGKKDPSYKFDWEVYTEILEGMLHTRIRWLDAGCGRNLWIDQYRDVELGVGVDRVAHPDLRGRDCFCLGDLSALPFRGSVFDLITCRSVVEHLSNPLLAFAEFGRVLKEGGTSLIQTTNRLAPLVFLANLLPWSWKQALIRALSGAPEQDIQPTWHRFNSPAVFRRGIPGFAPGNTVLTENLFTFSRSVFLSHHLLYILTEGSRFERYYSTITGTFRKL